jgi:hypothetical protein
LPANTVAQIPDGRVMAPLSTAHARRARAADVIAVFLFTLSPTPLSLLCCVSEPLRRK